MTNTLQRSPEETGEHYFRRMLALKCLEGWTWQELADILNEEFDWNLSSDAYRKRASKVKDLMPTDEEDEEDLDIELDEVIKERIKLRDERNQINSIARRITREETLKEMVKEAVSMMDETFKLLPSKTESGEVSSKAGILQLSDLHYGIEIDNYWNKYNPEICKERLSELRDKIIEIAKKEKIQYLYVINLGDLISGRIHAPLRINSRMDVVSQTQQISELVAQFLAELSRHFAKIEYYDCLDNHSRVEPIKEKSLDLESLARFVAWYLKERLRDFRNIIINDVNKYAPDIITFRVFTHKVVGVHGDKDKPSNVVQNMSLMTKEHYDLVLTSHRHHFSADEINQTLLISNGSLCGVDEYSEKLRLSAYPSQNLIIVSPGNVMEALYRIVCK